MLTLPSALPPALLRAGRPPRACSGPGARSGHETTLQCCHPFIDPWNPVLVPHKRVGGRALPEPDLPGRSRRAGSELGRDTTDGMDARGRAVPAEDAGAPGRVGIPWRNPEGAFPQEVRDGRPACRREPDVRGGGRPACRPPTRWLPAPQEWRSAGARRRGWGAMRSGSPWRSVRPRHQGFAEGPRHLGEAGLRRPAQRQRDRRRHSWATP